ncbi:MAG: glycosyltransferase family 1 protein [Candidatus Moraniibacteriota bacterium]
MRVGINASFLRKPDTGIGQVTLNFLRKVSESSHVEFILYLEEDLPNGLNIPKHFRKQVLLPLWKRDDVVRKLWWERCLVPKQAKRDGCDVFISLYQSASVMPKSIRHIMLVHDIIPKLFPTYLNNWRKKLHWKSVERGICHADKIYAVSSRTEKDLMRHLGISPSSISVNRIDVDPIFKRVVTSERSAEVMQKYHLSPGYLYNGGGLEVRKNAEGVLRAYRALLDREKSDHLAPATPPLVISGKLLPQLAPLVTDIEQMVKDFDLTPYVRILDAVPQRDLPALYAGARLFLYPSHYEGFGLPVLEAMSVGTPVVTSKVSSLPEVGKDAVLYCRPDSIDDIAATIRNALARRDLRDMLSKRGKERSMLFSWNEFSKKLLRSAIGEV